VFPYLGYFVLSIISSSSAMYLQAVDFGRSHPASCLSTVYRAICCMYFQDVYCSKGKESRGILHHARQVPRSPVSTPRAPFLFAERWYCPVL
jgi:hypothetical protein